MGAIEIFDNKQTVTTRPYKSCRAHSCSGGVGTDRACVFDSHSTVSRHYS